MSRISKEEAEILISKGPISLSGRAKDITGEKFGRLVVMIPVSINKYKQMEWLAKCECGNYTIIVAAWLLSGNVKSCGCRNGSWGLSLLQVCTTIAGMYSAKNNIPVDKIAAHSNKNVLWECPICGEVWLAKVNGIVRRNTTCCPKCAKLKQVESFNRNQLLKNGSILDKFPELNQILTTKSLKLAKNITIHSGKKLEIKCQKCGYIYKTTADNYANGRRCPCCIGQKVKIGFNDVATTFPKILKYWDKNNIIQPTEITKGSNKIVNLHCPKCGYIWQSKLNDLTNFRRKNICPACSGSSGERRVIKWLLENKINFIFNKQYDDKKIKPDFIIRSHNIWLEFFGKQHYCEKVYRNMTKKSVKKHSFPQLVRRDNYKRRLAAKDGLKYIEIPYTESARIEEILEKAIFNQEKFLGIKIPDITY